MTGWYSSGAVASIGCRISLVGVRHKTSQGAGGVFGGDVFAGPRSERHDRQCRADEPD